MTPILRWPEMRFAKRPSSRHAANIRATKILGGEESEHDCQQIDRQRVHVSWVADCILLEEYSETRAEFACAGPGDEISVVRSRGLVEEETRRIPRNTPGVKAEKEDESSDPQQNSQGFASYTGSASRHRYVIRHGLQLPGR